MTVFDWPVWALIVFAYVILQRLAELAYASANTRRLLAEGGREHGAKHYPLFIVLLLNAFIASQTFRFWTLASIGRWWTTRIISAPHFPRVRRGPYRFIKHPNYALVVVEIAVLPLLLGAPAMAFTFSILNAALLWWRIRIENAVLTERVGTT
jgi:methyltransferase